MVPHEHVMMYASKKSYKKRYKSWKFNEENFGTTRNSYKFHKKIAMPFVL